MSKKKKVIIATVAILVAAGIVGGSAVVLNSKSQSNNDTKVFVSAVSDNNTANSNMYSGNCFSGVVETQKSLSVKYDTSKKISEVFVEEGNQVKKGDKLFSYDVDSMQLQKEQAQLEIDKNNADIESKNKQITQLESDKKKASSDEQFSFATQIQSLKTEVSQAEYNIKVKKSEISQIEKSIENSTVTSEMDGVVSKLNSISQNSSDSDSTDSGTTDADVVMTIIADGDFRIKGKVNEQNMSAIYVDEPVIITSRTDDTVTWTGTISEISNEAETNNNNVYYSSDSDSYSTSSNYAFYITLDSNDNLMLGQHVIIEPDYGQSGAIEKTGIWLMQDYVMTDDDGKTYVWAADKKDKLEKRYVEVGQTDENNSDCEIVDGLSDDDFIAYPDDSCVEGAKVTTNIDDIVSDDGNIDDGSSDGEVSYDENGNIIDDGSSDGEVSYDENGNIIDDGSSDGEVSYDENGNIIDDGNSDGDVDDESVSDDNAVGDVSLFGKEKGDRI